MAKMSDKTKRAINKGRRNAGLKPIKFGATKKTSKRGATKKTSNFPKGTFTAKKNAEISKVEKRLEQIEDRLLNANISSATEKRLTKQYRKLQDMVSYIQFRKYK